MLVFRGLDLVGALLCGRDDLDGVTFLAVGRGDPAWGATPPAVPPTAAGLVAEVARVPLFDVSCDASGLLVRAELPAGLGDLREVALFGGDASARAGSGFLVSYRRHAPTSARARELRVVPPPGLEPGARELIARLLAGQRGGLTHAAIGTGERSAGAKSLGAEVARVPVHPHYDERTRTVVAQSRYEYAQGAGAIRESALLAGDTLVAYQAHEPLDRTHPRTLAQRFELSLTTDTPVTVPDVDGETLAAARTAIEAAGLTSTVEERETAPSAAGASRAATASAAAGPSAAAAPSAPVVAQDPPAGASARAGHVVTLTVAAPARVPVPRLAGATAAGASAALVAAGLKLGASTAEPSDAPAGRVLRSIPAEGARVEAGATVAIVVAAPRLVAVPDLRGQTPPVAQAVLAAAGLSLAPAPHATEESSADAGTVLAQNPTGLAPAGTRIEVTLATGWTVAVPDLSRPGAGEPQDELAKAGEELLARLGRPPQPAALVLGTRQQVEADADPGTIIGQRPPAGTRAALHQAVDIDVAVARTVAVPNLTGRPQLEAVAAVLDLKLVMGRIRAQMLRRAGLLPGTVLEQNPPEGVRVPVGTIVELAVATPVLAPVPDVRGLALDAARETLRSRGFDVSTVRQLNVSGKAGEVVAQVPGRHTQLALGSGVALDLVQGAPNVIGLQIAEATEVLKLFGIALNPTLTTESDAPVGTVLKQSAVSNGKITLTLATAFAIVVPQLVVPSNPLTVEAAAAALALVRLGLQQIGTVESDATPGVVAEQVPKAGTKVPPDSVIGVRVAVPRVPLEIVVPRVTNQKLEQARATLKTAGLTLTLGGEETSPQPAGNVIRQTPENGTKVPRNSEVSVVVALSPDATTTVVPDVRGLKELIARQRLTASKLFVTVETTPTLFAPPGTVVDQSPLNGVRVPINSEVRLVTARQG